jgi:single-strand DNA-binding protein
MNSVNVTARLTRDPELVETRGDTAIANLRVAIDRRGDGAVFADVKTFGAQAAACAEHLSKGDPVAVTGRLELAEWEARDGSKRSRLYVIAERVDFLGRQSRGEHQSPSEEVPAA